MDLRNFRLFNHHHYKTIRNVCLAIVVIALVGVPSVLSIRKQGEQTAQIRNLTKEVKSLSLENVKLNQQTKTIGQQAKIIGQQNQTIAKQNRSYSRCIATVFAKYTHDFVPITILNLDMCTLGSNSKATQNSSVQGTSGTKPLARQASPQKSSNNSSSPKSTPKKTPPQSNNPQSPNCTVDLLGIHLFC